MTAVPVRGGSRVALLARMVPHDRSLAILFLTALGVRLLIALATDFVQPFPDYYYGDARKFENLGRQLVAAWAGKAPPPGGESCGHLNYARYVAALFWVFGDQVLAVKIANGLAGAATVLLYTRLGDLVLGRAPALTAGWLLALWPSAAFWSAQNFRDSLVALCIVLVLFGFGRLTAGRLASGVLVAAVGLAGTTLLRPYATVILLGAAILWLASCVRPTRTGLAYAAAGLCLVGLLLSIRPGNALCLPSLWQATPQDISTVRTDVIRANIRQREIGTVLFPDVDLSNWRGLAGSLPRMMFYVLYMPLPGLYPLEGKLGRIAAAAENVVLLVITIVAVPWMLRGVRDPVIRYLLIVAAGFAVAYALVEPDLGSAMRHKPQYMSVIVLLSGPAVASWARSIAARVGGGKGGQ